MILGGGFLTEWSVMFLSRWLPLALSRWYVYSLIDPLHATVDAYSGRRNIWFKIMKLLPVLIFMTILIKTCSQVRYILENFLIKTCSQVRYILERFFIFVLRCLGEVRHNPNKTSLIWTVTLISFPSRSEILSESIGSLCWLIP